MALVRFSPDSARTKNAIAKISATQKTSRPAFDLFMLLVLFCAPAFYICFYIEPQLTPYGSSGTRCCAGTGTKAKQNVSSKITEAGLWTKKNVTRLLPARVMINSYHELRLSWTLGPHDSVPLN